MLTSIKGIYENGTITLSEQPETSTPMEVIVIFTKEIIDEGQQTILIESSNQ